MLTLRNIFRVCLEQKHSNIANSKRKKAERLTCQRQLAAFVYTDHMTGGQGDSLRRFAISPSTARAPHASRLTSSLAQAPSTSCSLGK